MQPTNLLVTAERSNGNRSLVFQCIRTNESVPILITPRVENGIGVLRKELPLRLQELHKVICGLRDPASAAFWDELSLAWYLFDSEAGQYLSNLFLENANVSRLDKVLADAFGLETNYRQAPARILLAFDVADLDLLVLPIEFLPIMIPTQARSSTTDVRGPEELEQLLQRYPAFAAIVTRRIQDAFDGRPGIERAKDSKIPIKVIRNHSFYSKGDDALKEKSDAVWLMNNSKLAPEPEWPDDTIGMIAAVAELKRSLIDPRITFSGEARNFADQIQHFSCHYTRQASGIETLGLREQAVTVGGLDIRLSVLSSALFQAVGKHEVMPSDFPGPLIFLNACGSGESNPQGSLSLTETLLLRAPLRAMIVTETPVDFRYASEFACKVYEELLDNHQTLGMAVHKARWSLIDTRRKPFGIFYSLYGNPDLQVSS